MVQRTPQLLKIENAIECGIISRLNRFVVEIEVDGKRYRASINNTGRLQEFIVSARRGFCLRRSRPARTDYRLFAIEERRLGAVIDTQLQTGAFERALEMGLVPWLDGYRLVRRNARLDGSLIDYLLERRGEEVYLEVKSAVLRDGDHAMYPDCPSARGRKHIRELTRYVDGGGRAIILFIAALPEVSAFKPNRQGDAELWELLLKARRAGVEIRALGMFYQPRDSSVHMACPDLQVELR